MGKSYHKDSHSFEDGKAEKRPAKNFRSADKKTLNNYVEQYYDYEEGITDEFDIYDEIDIQHKKQR